MFADAEEDEQQLAEGLFAHFNSLHQNAVPACSTAGSQTEMDEVCACPAKLCNDQALTCVTVLLAKAYMHGHNTAHCPTSQIMLCLASDRLACLLSVFIG